MRKGKESNERHKSWKCIRKIETPRGQTYPGQRNHPGAIPKAQAQEAISKDSGRASTIARGRGRTKKTKYRGSSVSDNILDF